MIVTSTKWVDKCELFEVLLLKAAEQLRKYQTPCMHPPPTSALLLDSESQITIIDNLPISPEDKVSNPQNQRARSLGSKSIANCVASTPSQYRESKSR